MTPLSDFSDFSAVKKDESAAAAEAAAFQNTNSSLFPHKEELYSIHLRR